VEGVSAAYVRIFTVSVPEVTARGAWTILCIFMRLPGVGDFGDFGVRSGLEKLLIIINILDVTIEVILGHSISNHWIN